MERKLYLLSPLQAEFYENESDRMYPDDVMDGRALAVYGADILQKMQERADHVGEDLMEYYDEKDSVKEKVTNLELSVVLKDGELMALLMNDSICCPKILKFTIIMTTTFMA